MPKKTFFVIGGDSLVGSSLVNSLKHRGYNVYASTRRKNSLDSNRIYFDFFDKTTYKVPCSVDHVLIVAAATNYEFCANDPRAREINVVCTPTLVNTLLTKNIFSTFISTNSVFGGDRPWPKEDDPHNPSIPYAQQKHDAENAMLCNAKSCDKLDKFSIVRLTKILDCETPPFDTWLTAWKCRKVIHPFSDLIFAPMSVQFVGESLAVLAEKRLPGAFHLSGAENVSYVEMAYALADRLGVDKNLIHPTTATEKGVSIAFKPLYSGLNMSRTTEKSGIQPQTLPEVVNDLYKQITLRGLL